jgi:hypothetical protein
MQRITPRAKGLHVTDDQPLAVYHHFPGSKAPKWNVRSRMDRLLKLAANASYDLTQAEVGQYSWHSMRVGASVILNAAGYFEMDITSCLRWKSDAYKVYLRNINVIAAKHTQVMSEVDIDQWCMVD